MTFTSKSLKLARLYAFFETYGTERLNGLGESYFQDMNVDEKEEAWIFLLDRFSLSEDNITGLYLLDREKAVDLFKQALADPIEFSPYASETKYLESNRLLMLKYVNCVEPNDYYLAQMCQFAKSQFAEIRAQFANSISTKQTTQSVVETLKGMVFTETDEQPLGASALKLLEIHGLDFDMDNPLFKSIFQNLLSNSLEKKQQGVNRLDTVPFPH